MFYLLIIDFIPKDFYTSFIEIFYYKFFLSINIFSEKLFSKGFFKISSSFIFNFLPTYI